MTREPGFYWVRGPETGWVVAAYRDGEWRWPGAEEPLGDADLDEIIEVALPAPLPVSQPPTPVGQSEGYVISYAQGEPYIRCLRCGRLSRNRRDIQERYCGHCHLFHDQEMPP
jgi:hypothetical protein